MAVMWNGATGEAGGWKRIMERGTSHTIAISTLKRSDDALVS
jgi:hypothetical protein